MIAFRHVACPGRNVFKLVKLPSSHRRRTFRDGSTAAPGGKSFSDCHAFAWMGYAFHLSVADLHTTVDGGTILASTWPPAWTRAARRSPWAPM